MIFAVGFDNLETLIAINQRFEVFWFEKADLKWRLFPIKLELQGKRFRVCATNVEPDRVS